MRDMKSQLILFNGISVAVYLLWIGYKLLEAFARNMGSTSGPGPNVEYVMGIVGVAAAACVVGSFFAPANLSKGIALAPLAFIVMGHVAMSLIKDSHYKERARERAILRAPREKKLSAFSKDYVYKDGMDGAPGGYESSFLTLDRTLQTLVRIDVGYELQMDAFPLGRINGEELETLEPPADLAKFYKRYVDSEGKTIFDRYALKHAPKQDPQAYRLEKYQ
jgi:hypothetical protein